MEQDLNNSQMDINKVINSSNDNSSLNADLGNFTEMLFNKSEEDILADNIVTIDEDLLDSDDAIGALSPKESIYTVQYA